MLRSTTAEIGSGIPLKRLGNDGEEANLPYREVTDVAVSATTFVSSTSAARVRFSPISVTT